MRFERIQRHTCEIIENYVRSSCLTNWCWPSTRLRKRFREKNSLDSRPSFVVRPFRSHQTSSKAALAHRSLTTLDSLTWRLVRPEKSNINFQSPRGSTTFQPKLQRNSHVKPTKPRASSLAYSAHSDPTSKSLTPQVSSLTPLQGDRRELNPYLLPTTAAPRCPRQTCLPRTPRTP